MCQTHQIMIALHSIPVVGEGVLIAVPVPFFGLDAHFDAPTLARAEVAALMERVGVQALAGQPYMVGLLIGQRAVVRVDFLPGFVTADHVYGEAFAVAVITVEDVVDPPELLLPTVPSLLCAVVGLAWGKCLNLFPHRGQA